MTDDLAGEEMGMLLLLLIRDFELFVRLEGVDEADAAEPTQVASKKV